MPATVEPPLEYISRPAGERALYEAQGWRFVHETQFVPHTRNGSVDRNHEEFLAVVLCRPRAEVA